MPSTPDGPTSADRTRLPIPDKEPELRRAMRELGAVLRSGASVRRHRTRIRRNLDRRLATDRRIQHGMTTLLARAAGAAARTGPLEPVLSARTRAGVERLGARYLRLKRPDAFHQLYSGVAAAAGPSIRVALSSASAPLGLNAGREPSDPDLVPTLLAEADRAWTARDHDRTADLLHAAFEIVFHRHYHFEDTVSPLGNDPDTFLAPFRASSAFRAMTADPGGREARDPAPTDRPLRLLATTTSNFNFLAGILAEYEQRPDVEVRRLDLRHLPDGPWRAMPRDLIRNRLRLSTGIPMEVPAQVRHDVDWADVVFAEWGHRAMAWMSMVPNRRARLVARIHSYEAFTQFPHITNWRGVDDVVFVSPHIRRLTEHTVPTMLSSGATIHTIPNRSDLAGFARPKRPGAQFTLGMVGWGQVVKDPLWAVDVLDALRAVDSRWTMRLIGADFAPDTKLTAAARVYRDRLLERRAELGDAIVTTGHVGDVAHELRRVGVILSTSHREGTHEGLIQGAASGAVPVVRNWPYVAKWGGAHTMFPSEWIVETPQQAADRILGLIDAQEFEAAGRAAANEVRSRYDWSVVAPRLEQVITGRGPR